VGGRVKAGSGHHTPIRERGKDEERERWIMMSRRGSLALMLALLGTAFIAFGMGGLRIEGLYRLAIDPFAPEVAQALRPGEAVSAAAPGELLLILGRGFVPDAVVMFSDREVQPLAPPLSAEGRLVVLVPPLPPGTVEVSLTTGGERSNGLVLEVRAWEGRAGRESRRAFAAMDGFLSLAGEMVRAVLEELPAPFQGFAAATVELLNRERLLALQLEGAVSGMSAEELRLLDGLFVSVGLLPLLQGYDPGGGAGEAPRLEGLRRTLEFKGSALTTIGEFLGQVSVTTWNGSEVTSAAEQDIGKLFRALGELDENLGGNVAFLARLLREAVWEERWLSLDQGIGDLALGVAALGTQLDDLDMGLKALAERLDRLGSELSFTLSTDMGRLEEWLGGITARLDDQIGPGIAGIIARLDSPDYGLGEIKAELTQLESQMALTVLPGLEELLRRPGAEAMHRDMKAIKAEIGQIEAELDDPDHGLAEIKAELRALEAKVDKIWRCLSGLRITWEELPGKVARVPVDVMLAIDSSGSMKTNDPRRLRIATAESFVEQLDPQRDQAGVVSWDNDIDFVQPLTGDLALVEQRIERVDASGATNLNVGLSAAIDEFLRGRPGVKRVIIFLTDGDGTYTFSGQPGSPAALARGKGITIYAIGLGSAPSRKKLEDMASATGGRFYIAPTAEDLRQIYEEISKQLVVPAERVLKMTCPTD